MTNVIVMLSAASADNGGDECCPQIKTSTELVIASSPEFQAMPEAVFSVPDDRLCHSHSSALHASPLHAPPSTRHIHHSLEQDNSYRHVHVS